LPLERGLWVQRLIDLFFKALEAIIVACLVAMVVMVFGNVVLRYTMNSGILISEEMSRYCFIWLTYIGAMVAMREKGHLGVDTLVRRLPLLGKKVCLFLCEILMLICNLLFLQGTWRMHELQVTNVSPVVMALINLHMLYKLLTGQLQENDLVVVIESEGLPEAAAVEASGVRK
jgi:TRAP-type C4-dicarboxylate transport system permease small subunit